MRSKIQKAMTHRDNLYKLGGNIEADEIWIGGAQTFENRRKNGPNKTPFFIALQENKSGQPMFVTTSELEGVFENHISKAVGEKIKPNSTLKTDGKGSYIEAAVQGNHALEQSVTMREPRTTHEHLKWVNILTSNLKRYLLSTHHRVFKDYRKEYLAEFAYRFNRRYWPEQAFDRLLFANLFKGPTPIRRLGG
jgi:transposase-like protein